MTTLVKSRCDAFYRQKITNSVLHKVYLKIHRIDGKVCGAYDRSSKTTNWGFVLDNDHEIEFLT